MIEKKEAVENLEPILEQARTKGVDMVQWDPADYRVSMGDPKLFHSASIHEVEENVI
tara:strand:+ start:123 stop:293 length:171 start_codon:yes stop_codon:yes gene_type:complete